MYPLDCETLNQRLIFRPLNSKICTLSILEGSLQILHCFSQRSSTGQNQTPWFYRAMALSSMHLISWNLHNHPVSGAGAVPVPTSKQRHSGLAEAERTGQGQQVAKLRFDPGLFFPQSSHLTQNHCTTLAAILGGMRLSVSHFFRGFWNDCSLDSPTSQITSDKKTQNARRPSHSLEMPPPLSRWKGTAPSPGSRSYKFPCER